MSCSICMSDISNKVTTPCKHSFCNGCLTNWLLSKSSCPMCRYKIGDIQEQEQEEEEEDEDIDLVEEFNENLKKDYYNILDDYVIDFENAMWDLIDNIDNQSYLDSKRVQIVNDVYMTEVIYKENKKIVSAIIAYYKDHDYGKLFYNVRYDAPRVKTRRNGYNKRMNQRMNKISRKNKRFYYK